MLRPCQLVSLLGTVFLLLGEVGDDDDDKHDDDNDLWGQLPIVCVWYTDNFFCCNREKNLVQVRGLGDAVYAVNCGGETHTDLFGIKVAQETSFQGPMNSYQKMDLMSNTNISSMRKTKIFPVWERHKQSGHRLWLRQAADDRWHQQKRGRYLWWKLEWGRGCRWWRWWWQWKTRWRGGNLWIKTWRFRPSAPGWPDFVPNWKIPWSNLWLWHAGNFNQANSLVSL